MQKGPIVLLILDGWGIAKPNKGNAIELAKKPHFDKYWKQYPHTKLKAHGKYVGVPDNQVGNSEAGHLNIGAGRLVIDDAVLISNDIKTSRFKKNLALNQTMDYVLKKKSNLHLMGLASDGTSPHGDLRHLFALVDLAHSRGVQNIYLHLFTDGRDSPQFAALKICDKILKKIKGKAKVVSVMGRFYAMDRIRNWKRTQKAYDCLTQGSSLSFDSYKDAIMHAYNQGETDEYIEPAIICKDKKQAQCSRISDNDGIVFFNLRSDRARQLTKCFVQKDFNSRNPNAFKRKKVLKNIKFCALTDFGDDLDHLLTAYPGSDLKHTLPHLLKNKKQLYIAETEKYAHVTYFINGGHQASHWGENTLKIPSPKLKSYAQKPQMSVYEITKKVLKFLNNDKYQFITINFANPDMVGHTGDLKAAIKAIEHCDYCLHEIAKEVQKKNGMLLITADHGNAEKMIDLQTNEVWVCHTTNPVPFILICNEHKGTKLKSGALSNIAPTIYQLFEFEKIPKVIINSLIK